MELFARSSRGALLGTADGGGELSAWSQASLSILPSAPSLDRVFYFLEGLGVRVSLSRTLMMWKAILVFTRWKFCAYVEAEGVFLESGDGLALSYPGLSPAFVLVRSSEYFLAKFLELGAFFSLLGTSSPSCGFPRPRRRLKRSSNRTCST